jgi:Siphovirus Gp157
MRPLDPAIISRSIANLLLQNPELAEDEVLRADMIEGETDAFALLTDIVRRIEDAKALEVGTAGRLAELKTRKERFGRRIDGLRTLAFKIMEACELSKLEMAEATLSLRNVAPSVVIVDEESLPDIACKFERKPDKAKIKELLMTGPVSGASMGNGSKAISIRIK